MRYSALNNVILIVFLLLSIFLTTFRLLKVPPGIETDEGTISYNAALIAKTLHDQNHRLLPFFILSRDGIDWKQPVSIYLTALFFKVFGTSLLTFKLVNVVLAFITLLILMSVLNLLFNFKAALVGSVIFITTPMVLISARIGTEVFLPIFISTAWILCLVLFRKHNQKIYLALSALILGIGFYSYKGMRLIVPLWGISTVMYIFYNNFTKRATIKKKLMAQLLVFTLTIAPFFLIIPFLEQKYPGGVLDRTQIHLETYRHYALYWLSNLSLSQMFVQGDMGRVYVVEQYGVFLLGSLPLFLLGVKRSIDKPSFYTFILFSYLITPALFGISGSMGYGHRLAAMIPQFVIIATLGFQAFSGYLNKTKKNTGQFTLLKTVGVLTIGFYIINFFNFSRYYYFEYPRLNSTQESFRNNLNQAFYVLSKKSSQENLPAYVQEGIYTLHWEGNKFFETAYFKTPLKIWKLGDPLPNPGLLLTEIGQLDGAMDIQSGIEPLHILKSN